nr:hypothetical protein [Tanacetum cinerariifolium]
MVSATKDPLTFNDLMATPIDFSNIELEYNFQECFNTLTAKLDWNNLEGDHYPFDLSKPLPLQGPLGHRIVAVDYFCNNDLEYLKTSDPEVTYTTSTTKTKAARKAYVVINKHTMKVEESLNVTFDESPPSTKLSPLVDDDVGEEEAIKKNTKVVNNNNEEDESIEVDGIINIKESKNHPLDQVTGNLNQRTLRSQA